LFWDNIEQTAAEWLLALFQHCMFNEDAVEVLKKGTE
jgi:hypothetical protein